MWVTSLGLAGEAGIFASLPFYPMFSGVPNGPLRLSPPQVHAAVHNSGDMEEVILRGLHEFLDGLQIKLDQVGDAIFDSFFALKPVG